jgi:hypothetical protein
MIYAVMEVALAASSYVTVVSVRCARPSREHFSLYHWPDLQHYSAKCSSHPQPKTTPPSTMICKDPQRVSSARRADENDVRSGP